MKIFLKKLLLSTNDNFVTWEYLAKFDGLIGFHADFDVTITRRDLATPRFSVIVNTREGDHIRLDVTPRNSLYFLVVDIRHTAIAVATVISI